MQFDSKERQPFFYVILFAILIFAVVFFAKSVKKAVTASQAQGTEVSQSQSVNEVNS